MNGLTAASTQSLEATLQTRTGSPSSNNSASSSPKTPALQVSLVNENGNFRFPIFEDNEAPLYTDVIQPHESIDYALMKPAPTVTSSIRMRNPTAGFRSAQQQHQSLYQPRRSISPPPSQSIVTRQPRGPPVAEAKDLGEYNFAQRARRQLGGRLGGLRNLAQQRQGRYGLVSA